MSRCASIDEKLLSLTQAKRNRGNGFKKEVEELVEHKNEIISQNNKTDKGPALNWIGANFSDKDQGKEGCMKMLAQDYPRPGNVYGVNGSCL